MATRAAHLEILVTADTDRAQRDLGGVERKVGLFSRIGRVAKAAMLGFGVAAIGGAIAGKKMLDSASNLSETVNKVNVIFGRSASGIKKWGEQAIDSMGMSEQSALDAAAIFGVFGKSAGLTGQSLVGFSEKLTNAAADLSSFHNVPIADALDAIRSGLAGETEPLRRFGILLNDAELRQQALKMGLVDTTKNALTPQQRTLAAQELILRKLGPATGDYTRTQGGLANTTRRLQERLGNLTAHMGRVLIPIAGRVVGALDGVFRAIDRIVKAKTPTIALRVAWRQLKGLGAQLWEGLQHAVAGSDRTIDIPRGRVTFHRAGLGEQLAEALKGAIASVDWGDVGSRIANGIAAGLEFTQTQLERLIDTLTEGISANIDTIAEAGALILAAIASKLLDPSFWMKHWELFLTLAISLIPGTKLLSIGGKVAMFLFRGLGRAGGRLLIAVFERLFGLIPGTAVPAARAIASRFFGVFRSIGRRAVTVFLNIASRLPGILQRAVLWIMDAFPKAWQLVLVVAGKIWTAIRGRISSALEAVGKKISGSVIARFAIWLTKLAVIHTAIVGVRDAFQWVIDKVKSLIEWIGKIHVPDLGSLNPLNHDLTPGFNAAGTLGAGWRGGLTWVGEKGRELVDLPTGSRIRTNAASEAAAAGGDQIVNLTMNVNGQLASHPSLLLDRVGYEIKRRGVPRLVARGVG